MYSDFCINVHQSEVRLRISSYIQCKKGNLKKISFECWKDFQLTFQHSKMNKSMLAIRARAEEGVSGSSEELHAVREL